MRALRARRPVVVGLAVLIVGLVAAGTVLIRQALRQRPNGRVQATQSTQPTKPPQPTQPVETAPPGRSMRSEAGDLLALVRSFVASMPDRHERATESERARLAEAWSEVRAGHLDSASDVADPLGYDVVRFTDAGTDRQLVMLREREPLKGWGLFIHDGGTESRFVVEVAHPMADILTEEEGVEAFRVARAKALLVAGVNRDRADVAHETDTPFHRVHEATVTSQSAVFQPHGFHDRTYPGYDLVVSNGGKPTALTDRVTRALEREGFRVCEYDGHRTCARLAATENVQGDQTRATGGEFVHVEASRSVRDDAAARGLVARVVAEVAG